MKKNISAAIVALNAKSDSCTTTFIWRLTETEETRDLFARLDTEVIESISHELFDAIDGFQDDDLQMPCQVKDMPSYVVEKLVNNISDLAWDWRADFGVYGLSRIPLNTNLNDGNLLLEDPDFEVKKGAVVYEAALRIVMGCDMAYVLSPIGYFTRRIEHPSLANVEWIERKLL